jgi:hypothetical protein
MAAVDGLGSTQQLPLHFLHKPLALWNVEATHIGDGVLLCMTLLLNVGTALVQRGTRSQFQHAFRQGSLSVIVPQDHQEHPLAGQISRTHPLSSQE